MNRMVRFLHLISLKAGSGPLAGVVGALILSAFLTSCGGHRPATEEMDSEGPASVMPDTFVDLPAEEETVADKDSVERKPLNLKSREEILEYISQLPDKAEYEAGIIPTIAEYVPEYASKLLDNPTDGFLIVDKNTMKLYRYDKYGRELENVGIACSKRYGTKHKKADNRTPEGFFTIEGIYDSTEWLYTDDDGNTSPAKGQFGPRYMRLRTPVTSQVGIHGTSAPWSIGGRRSHGCIRMTNENIMRIHKLCKAGMPVIVSPGPRDMAVNIEEGYDVPAVPVKRGGVPCKPGKYSEAEKEKKAESEAAKTATDSVSSRESVAPSAPVHETESVNSPEPAKESNAGNTSVESSPEQQ